MDIDWGKEAQGTRELVPDNVYRVRIKRWEKCTASTGNDQIRWFAEIIEPEDYAGKTVVEHTVLTEPALWRIASLVSAAKVPVKDVPKMKIGSEVFYKLLDLIKGQTMYWSVFVDAFQGKKSNKVSEFIQDEAAEELDIDKLEDIPEFLKDKK